MSLILEALKKLDREKQAPDRGLLVVGPAEWPTARDSRPGVRAAAGIALLLSAIGAAVWLYGGRPSTVARREMPSREVATRESAPRDVLTPDVPAREQAAREPAAQEPTARDTAARDTASRTVPPRDERAALAAPSLTMPKGAAVPKTVPSPAPAARVKDPKPAAGTYQLQAISAQEGQPVAILNDQLVREGDTFDGARVVRIGADEVEIEVAGRRRVLKF